MDNSKKENNKLDSTNVPNSTVDNLFDYSVHQSDMPKQASHNLLESTYVKVNGGHPIDILPEEDLNAENTEDNSTDFDLPNWKETEALASQIDPWALPEFQVDAMNWHDMTKSEKIKRVLFDYIGKFVMLLILLYFFICSLDLLSSAFKLIGGKTAGKVFMESKLLNNSIAGLMIGVLATVLLQSSSTTTSIIVTMVASGILTVKPAIPIIMGANIGTSVTNTIVSMASATRLTSSASNTSADNKKKNSTAKNSGLVGQSAKKSITGIPLSPVIPRASLRRLSTQSINNEFRRAFAAATVHDMFNWLTVCVLLPLESLTGLLYYLTLAIVNKIDIMGKDGTSRSISKANNKEILGTITKPFTSLIVMLDSNVMNMIAIGNVSTHEPLLKHWCTSSKNAQPTPLSNNLTNTTYVTKNVVRCRSLFSLTKWNDNVVGAILLVISLVMLTLCLILIVKVLHSMLKGKIALGIRKVVNSDIPRPFTFLTGYLAILVGAACTFLLQSSSVFTSALTPLVGIGVISLERVYPLTLGSNLGTTATGLLASLTASPQTLKYSVQIALCHTFFNLLGISMWYPIPALRFPLTLCKIMGATTAKYNWFAIFYLVIAFFVLPGSVFALSTVTSALLPETGDRVSSILIFVMTGITACLVITIICVNKLQKQKPHWLPPVLRNWLFLPHCFRSLEPLDRCIQCLNVRRIKRWFKSRRNNNHDKHSTDNQTGIRNGMDLNHFGGNNKDASTFASTNTLLKNASFGTYTPSLISSASFLDEHTNNNNQIPNGGTLKDKNLNSSSYI